MAVRKRRALTPEEQLEAALVPETEWPYAIPDNWCWVRWGSVGDFVAGSAFKNAYQGFKEYEIPFYKVGSLKYAGNDGYLYDTSNTINSEIRVILKAALIPADSILFAKIGEAIRLNRRRLNDVPCCIDNNMMAFVPHACDRKYAYYWSQDVDMYELTNATTVPAIRKTDLEALPFPLPPLHEQRRIASRIEWLFSRLDDAEAELREIIDNSEQRQAVILHKAISGELTESWRKEHGVGREAWTVSTLADVCTSIFDGDHMPPPKADEGIPFLVISNVNDGHLSFEDTRYVPESYYDNLTATRKPQVGDVLYTLVGSYGIPVMVDDERPFCFQRHMALLRPGNIEQKYLWYLLRSQDMFEKATAIATGTAQLTVPIKGLRKLEFECPGADERAEIVRRLDALLVNEERVRSLAQSGLESAALTRQSVLARALHGELGTNDPDEASSKELLANIINGNAGKR